MDSHSSYLLQQLQEQRIQGLLCDCMLVVKGVCFKAHKNVLAAFSSYFRSLFQTSSTQKSDVFNLVIQDVSGIGQILDYFYTSRLDVNQDNVRSLLDIAQCLQVPNVQNMCSSFLRLAANPNPASMELTLNKEQECVLRNDLLQDVEPNLDLDKSRKLSCTSDVSGGAQGPVERQLLHGYKLRNFYSKQYFKQISSSSSNQRLGSICEPNQVCEQQPMCSSNPTVGASNPTVGPSTTGPSTAGASNTTVGASNPVSPSSSWTSGEKSASLTPSYNLNSSDIKQTINVISNQTLGPVSEEPSVPNVLNNTASNAVRVTCSWMSAEKMASLTPAEDAADTTLNRSVRPKKAVYLKKYNYLGSQRASEEMCVQTSQKALEEICLETASVKVLCQKQLQESTGEPAAHPADQTESKLNEADMETLTNPNSLSPNREKQGLDPFPPPQRPPQSGPRHYNCPQCGKIFKHPSNLELHKRCHTGEKPFQCNICDRHFTQAGNLQTHLRRHSGEKPYICELCGKSFTASGDVQRHKVVHSGERPHLCDICGRGFNNLSNLREHERTHLSEKSFTCDECGKSFNTNRKRLKHRARHSGEKPHTCATCGKSFVGSGDLQRHIRSHTGEKPYICPECGKSFSRSAMLRRHCQNHCRGNINNSTTKPKSKPHSFTSALPHSPAHTGTTNMSAILETTNLATISGTANKDISPGTTIMATSPTELQSLVTPQDLSGQTTKPQSLLCGSTRSLPKSNEGQLMSSVTLWGLAMKTLQNSDLE